MLTVPVLCVLTIVVLFSWPGLHFKWELNDQWFLKRGDTIFSSGGNHTSMDKAVLRAGPVQITRLFRNYGAWFSHNPGFFLDNDPEDLTAGCRLNAIEVSFTLFKRWPWR